MPWKKGQPSPNPGGRPKVSGSIRAQARLDSQEAYEALLAVMRGGENVKPSEMASAAVQVLRLAGVSFASESEEVRNAAETARASATAGFAHPKLEEIIGTPTLPLN